MRGVAFRVGSGSRSQRSVHPAPLRRIQQLQDSGSQERVAKLDSTGADDDDASHFGRLQGLHIRAQGLKRRHDQLDG